MDTDALGRKALAAELRASNLVKPARATKLACGDTSPSLDLALQIEELTGIPPSIWKTPNRGAAMWARMMERKT